MGRKKTIHKTLFREIRGSLGRYLAILAIIALGVGFFSGLKICRTAMLETGDTYLREHGLFDFRLLSTMGITEETVEEIGAVVGVKKAAGAYTADVLAELGGSTSVLKVHSITDGISELALTEGRMPEQSGECVIDSKARLSVKPGDTVTLADENESDTLALFGERKSFTVVGIVHSPLYLNYERGTTTIGSGSVGAFLYLPEEAFTSDYYQECYVTLEDSGKYRIYSEEYDGLADRFEEILSEKLETAENSRFEKLVSDKTAEIGDARKQYGDGLAAYEQGEKELSEKLGASEAEIDGQETALREQEAELQETLTEVTEALEETKASLALLENVPGVEAAAQRAALETAAAQLQAGLDEANAGMAAIREGYDSIEKARAALAGEKEKAEKELAEKKQELDSALAEIEEAERAVAELSAPDTYVLGRDTNVGYVCFQNDAEIVESISKVFPVFFFLIAALVCMTTMTRMVDEQRTQIGVLKAMGYSNGAVASKYVLYSGSAALIGCMAGYFAGTYFFPLVIWRVYDILYGFAPIRYVLDPWLALIAVLVSLLCSVGATLAACIGEFTVMPAVLIRPKAPKSGKRVLLERIPFLWKRMRFSHKVSVRNVFRYKKRLIMMVLGIGGCTALLLTGFGIRDSIQHVVDDQFDRITVYDLAVSFSKDQTEEKQRAFCTEAALPETGVLFVHERSVDLAMNGTVKSVYLVASATPEVGSFVRLHSGSEPVAYPGVGEAVVNQKLADLFSLRIGDEITVRNEDQTPMTLKVTGIFDNYIYNYIYVLQESCTEAWGAPPEVNCAYVNLPQSGEAAEAGEEDAHLAAAALSDLTDVSSVSVYADLRERMDNTLSSLNYIVLLVIVCAAALAFIVLYNLNNINITERVREIATLKVLGFYAGETSSYVFRENILLTLFGAVLGLPLGKLLHLYVMAQINIDMVSFNVRIEPLSYLAGIALTFVFAVAADVMMSGKLRKISMTESLKSVE